VVASSKADSKPGAFNGLRIPLRFEPCLPETCGNDKRWRYVGVGTSHRVLIGDRRIGILSSAGKGKAFELSILEFNGTTPNAQTVPGSLLRSEANYFQGGDKSRWHTNVPEYDGVTLQNLYPGVDIRFYHQGAGIEFDVQAQPGADLSAVRMHADKQVHVLDGGDVKLGDGDSVVTIHIPAAYQIDSAQHRLPVTAGFTLAGDGTVALKTGPLQAGLATVVDPTIAFSTLLAQSSETSPYPDDVILTNVAVDGSGNIWVAGTAYGPFPSLSTNSQLDCSASCVALGDNYVGVAFAAKFDPSGNLLVSDELGRTVDNTVGMTLDSEGNVYLDGDTEDGLNFPTTAGAFDTGATSYQLYKVFVSKIDSTGSNLVFSTLLGSTSGQTGTTNLIPDNNVGNAAPQSIAVDSKGNVYVGGATQASDFPVTANAIKSTCGASTCPGWNGFVAEFNPTGSALVYSTLFGGSGSGTQVSQLVLASGKIIVSGVTQDTTFPVSATAIHRTMGSCDLAGAGQSDYLSSIDPTKSGSAGLIFSTFVCEEIQSMALDSSNNIYLGVITPAGTNNTPPTPGSFVTLLPNTACNTPECTIPVLYPGIAVEEISADGSQVLKMSYLNASQQSALDSIAVDATNNVYVSGHIWMNSAGSPIVNGVQPYLGTATECNNQTWRTAGDTNPACSGLFLMKLDPQMDAPIFATIYGPQNGSVIDNVGLVPSWLAVDSTGNIYAAGWESLVSWPTGTFQNRGIGTQEGYLLKITDVPANPGVLLTSDHLFYPSCTNGLTGCTAVNNYNQSETQTVTVVNHSGSTIQIESIKGDGTAKDPIRASQNCIGSLDDESACSVTVSFTPQLPGDLTGTVTITDTSSTSPHVITGIGTGWMGDGQPASTSLTFPSTAVGQSSAAQTILFNNIGNLQLNVSGVTVTGDFAETDNCSGGINVGTSCAINVVFKPTAAGAQTGTLSIADDGAGSPHVVNLSGTGSGPAAVVSPSTLTFAPQTTGTTSAAQKVTLTDSGTSALSITSIAASGDFGETNTCGLSVAASTNCIVSVTFTPTASGVRTGTLMITDSASSSPQTVSLTGTGISPASATVSPTSLTFASQTQGTTSTAQAVTLTNSGGSALGITSIVASGDFAETQTCGSTLAAGANCTISVTFTPTATGTRTGALTITDDASGSPQPVALTGTGAVAVKAATTTTTLAVTAGGSASTTVASGSLVTLKASVTAAGTAVTPGVVTFCDTTVDTCAGSGLVGTAQLTSAGTATLRFFPGTGVHNYEAVFEGTGANASSTSSQQQLTVTGTTTTTITSSGSAGNYTLTGTVAAAGSTVLPTGTVKFSDSSDNFPLGTGTLGASTAVLSLANASATPSLGTWSPYFTAVGDFNGDGKLDLVVTDAASGPTGETPANALFVFLGNGDGTFTAAPATPLVNSVAYAVAVGDFNNDGKADLAVLNNTNTVTILLGNGDGTFAAVRSESSTGDYPESITAGDFNGDGILDLAVTNSQGSSLTILLGNGDGTFRAGASSPETGSNPMYVVAGDFNGDGKLDLAVANEGSAAATILLGNGDGTFTTGASLTLAGTSTSAPGNAIAMGDFNGDGKIDLAVESLTQSGTSQTFDVNVFLGNGDGTFSAQPALAIPGDTNAYSIAATDFNGDGKTDLVAFDDQAVTIFLSNGDGTFTASATTTGSTTSPDNDYIAIGDFTGNGIPDLALADSDLTAMRVLLVRSTETATATLESVSIPGSGTQNITAAYGGNTVLTGSASSAIQLSGSQVSTTLSLTSSTTSLHSGQQLTLTATLAPYSDQSLTTSGETVSFSSGGKSLGSGQLASGIATLNASSLPVGTDSVVATYAGDANFASATSSAVSIVVSPAVPSVTLSPASLTFASQTTGSTSAPQTVTLTNSGQAALSITAISATGDFAETQTCGSSVAVGANCTISVTFTPTAAGSRTGTLTITDNASGSPQTVSLSGTGTSVTVSTPSTGLTVSSAGGSATATIQLTPADGFTGTVNLTCNVTYTGQGTATDPPTCSLNPSQATVTGGTAVSTTLTISTTAASSSARLGGDWRNAGRILAAFLFLGLIPRRRWKGLALLALLCIVGTAAIIGCGGGSSGGGGTTPPTNPGTTAGNYSVTVTATSGTITASTTIPISVQ
jgi:hypothetical protein